MRRSTRYFEIDLKEMQAFVSEKHNRHEVYASSGTKIIRYSATGNFQVQSKENNSWIDVYEGSNMAAAVKIFNELF